MTKPRLSPIWYRFTKPPPAKEPKKDIVDIIRTIARNTKLGGEG